MDPDRVAVPCGREIGHAGGYAPGPTLICVAALHGNEPAGVRALRRVFDGLLAERLSIRGEFAGLVGNVAALRDGRRHTDEDMNRMWGADRVDERGRSREASSSSEVREQGELIRELNRLLEHATGEVLVLDFHTASSDTPPFTVLGDTLRNREFARRFPLPIVLGLEEHILGTLMEHMSERGHIGVAVEGGRHDDPAAVDHLESAAWLALACAGCLDRKDIPNADLHEARLRRAVVGIPAVLEIIHRHEAAPDFRMKPGLQNFQPVRRGEALATEDGRTVPAPRAGRVFLPRYQPTGNDGFFMARPVNPVWLALSARLRRTSLPALTMRLPGVRRHVRKKNSLEVRGRLARRLTRKVFHLLGFRVLAPQRGGLLLERRRETPATRTEGTSKRGRPPELDRD